MKVDKNETSKISVNEVRNLDPKSIKVINLVDGSKIIINNNESSQNQNQPETTGKPIFTEVKDKEIINKYLSQINTTQKHQCRCHQHHVQEQMQNNQTWESQNENYSNYQYYQQEPNMSQSQETGGTQKLRNVNGPSLNDMITYNDQGNNNGQYYNSGEEGFVGTDENGQSLNQYSQPQSENYYVNPQVYEQNVQGEMQENEYQPEQEYEQGYDYQQGYGYDQNQEQFPPQEDQNKNEENNANEHRTTVIEIITKDVNEEKNDEDKKDEEINNEEKNEDKNEEENRKENEEEKEENNVIQNKEDENQNPLPEVNDMISGDENKAQNEEQENEKKEEIKQNEENNNNVEDNKENVNENENEQPKKEGYYYVQDGEKYPREDQAQAQEQNQEEFKESEYKGDEEEAEAENNNKKKEEDIPKKKEETEPNSGVPRPNIPIAKIQYYEYSFPKRVVKPPFPGRPIKFLFEEAVYHDGGRSQSNPHTMNPSFGRIFPRPHIVPKRDFIPPMHRLPPRPLFIPPQMSYYQPRPPIFPPHMQHFPPRPQFMPPHMHHPGPHFAPPYRQHYPHAQIFPPEKQRFPQRPQFKYYPQPQQRYAYPSPHRRFEEFNESFQPMNMNKTNYFSERSIFSPMGNNLSYNKGNFYSYKVMRPQTAMQTRSVSNSKSDRRFATYSYGLKKPKPMFKRVENRRIVRATGANLNTQKA